MTTPALADLPIRDDTELTERWATLLAGPTGEHRALWMAWLRRDGTMLPVLMPVDDLPAQPDPRALAGLIALFEAVMSIHLQAEPLPEDDDDVPGDGSGIHLALALARPGGSEPTEDDLEWADELRGLFEHRADGGVSVQLCCDDAVLPLVRRDWWPRPD